MREILFRGKRIDNGEWVEGFYHFAKWYLNGNFTGKITYYIRPIGAQDAYQVDPKTVGQFTGLTDKNGKKIFEGDIIRYADEYKYRMYLESLECPEEYEGVDFSDLWTVDEVIYGIKVGYPAFDLRKHDFESNGLSELHESCNYFYEVIGNIHDNPELLEVSNNE